jgi:hypothetical protein
MAADSSRHLEIAALEYLFTLPSPPDGIAPLEATIEANFARTAAHLTDALWMLEPLKQKGGAWWP